MSLLDRVREVISAAFALGVLVKFLGAIVFGFGIGLALRTEPTTVPDVGPVSSPFVGAAILAAGAIAIAAITTLRAE
jgi:hypothetical protein